MTKVAHLRVIDANGEVVEHEDTEQENRALRAALTRAENVIKGPGLCECGCGEQTELAPKTSSKWGLVKGKPKRYVRGHHGRLRRSQRLFEAEDRGYDTPCWIWQLALGSHGYALVHIEGATRMAHRVAYEHFRGPIPPGLHLDHLCRVPACVNPDHLEPVTCAVNTQRGAWAVLTAEAIVGIRRALESGETQEQIGRRYGISQGHVSQIKTGVIWGNVA